MSHYPWFLVMGTWPAEALYKAGGPCGVWGKKSDPVTRLCVKPDHHRDGAADKHRGADVRVRWRASAQSGFPPEFRTASQRFMSSEVAEEKVLPLLLYRGNLSAGRAHALFNWTLLAQAEEAARLGDIVESSKAWPDAAHAVGLHKPLTTTRSVVQFWGRMLDNPTVMDGHVGLKDYIETTLAASNVRPYQLDRIDRYSHWSTRAWRRIGRPSLILEPMTEVWPFLPAEANSEHDLVMAVDGLVPKNLPEIVRQDVCQDMLLAVLEGEFTVDQLKDRVEPFIKQVFKQFPTKYGPISLDMPSPWSPDDSRTLGEKLAAPDPMPTLGEEYADLWSGIREAVEAGGAA